MIALSAREEWDYVLESERGTENPTVFRLRPLTLVKRIEVEDMIGIRGCPYGSINAKVLRAGLAGWSSMSDRSGAEVRFVADRTGRITDELLERLPSLVCTELANEILTHSSLSEGDRKN
jgi:hypothetical protein